MLPKARLVLRDVREELAEERAPGGGLHVEERAEGEPLEDDLHANHLRLPVGRLHDVEEERLEDRLDRVDPVELADVPAEDLDVARLVHRLRRDVELRLVVRHGGDELAGDHERALLAVEELREDPRRVVGVEGLQGARVEALEEGELEEGHALGVEDLAAGIDGEVPVEGDVGVPLVALGLHVELVEAVLVDGVGPVPDGLERGGGLLGRHGH
jgi:hypothetical protein